MMHGKTSLIKHNGKDLFAGMPNPFPATRYHSLVIQRDSVPDCLEITAETEEGEIMGVKHKQFPIWGVQFHPDPGTASGNASSHRKRPVPVVQEFRKSNDMRSVTADDSELRSPAKLCNPKATSARSVKRDFI
jgi:GMP synthase-like glutamine amidotransferase